MSQQYLDYVSNKIIIFNKRKHKYNNIYNYIKFKKSIKYVPRSINSNYDKVMEYINSCYLDSEWDVREFDMIFYARSLVDNTNRRGSKRLIYIKYGYIAPCGSTTIKNLLKNITGLNLNELYDGPYDFHVWECYIDRRFNKNKNHIIWSLCKDIESISKKISTPAYYYKKKIAFDNVDSFYYDKERKYYMKPNNAEYYHLYENILNVEAFFAILIQYYKKYINFYNGNIKNVKIKNIEYV